MEAVTSTTEATVSELVKLSATNSEFYCRTFFPKAFRQRSPQFATEIWDALDNPEDRLLNLMCFRGSAKTTRLRAFASKRIAYGISRTILYIGNAEKDAIRSVNWLRNQVDRNTLWSSAFGLEKGNKWEETQIEIHHKTFGHTIWVLAAGISGSLRGINFDDYRPDLIIVDDALNDEDAASEPSREKINDLILSAVKNSLAPIVDEPNAKLVNSGTPQHPKDVCMTAKVDPSWRTLIYGCWTPETIDLPVSMQESSWPERFSSEELRKDKLAHIKRNKLSLFTREMECRLTSKEKAAFKSSWINIRPQGVVPVGSFNVLAIDPVPPPSDRQLSKSLANKDFEAHYVWGRIRGEYHCLDYAVNRGHDPSWSVSNALSMARKWRVAKIVVEAVNYQRTLKWIIEQEMKRRGVYYMVVPFNTEGRKKFIRITSVFNGLASNGLIHIGVEHSRLLEQFENYPDVENDDDLDASSIALGELSNPYLGQDAGLTIDNDDNVEEFPYVGGCP